MNQKTPGFKRHHASGQYFVRWGGQFLYLGRDRDQAYEAYLKQLALWSEWRKHRNARRLPPMTAAWNVRELADAFVQVKRNAGGADLETYYRKHLKRFVAMYQHHRADAMRAVHLFTLQQDLIAGGYAPKTVNHDVVAVRSLFKWGAQLELIPPSNLDAVKQIRLPPPPNKAISLAAVRRMVLGSAPPLNAWLALNYLCLMRPIEVVRLANRTGEWVHESVYRIIAKGRERHVIVSPEARNWIHRALPRWTRLDSYSQAARREAGQGPHRLRHSAATHLARAGVDRQTVDLLLGHLPARVSLTYASIEWPALVHSASKLTLV